MPTGWYPRDGKLYDLTSKVGKALNSLDDDFKEDWIIKVNNGKINVPNAFYETGNGYFERPVNGNDRQIGSIENDAIRNITGEFGGVSEEGDFTGAFRRNKWVGSKEGTNVGMYLVTFDASRVVPTDNENRPKNVGMTPAIYLGV